MSPVPDPAQVPLALLLPDLDQRLAIFGTFLRLRIQLIRGRLPRPLVQSELCDSKGRFVGRVDLYYPDRRLAIEYDGAGHKDRLHADLQRQNALLNAGYHLLRFTGADLREPISVVAEVRKVRATLPVIRDSPD